MTKTTEPKTIEHREADATAISIPSMNIDHASVFLNELDTRLMGFDSGIMAVVADIEGAQKRYEQECADKAKTHATYIEERHRLKRDLERGRQMAHAAKLAYDQPVPPDVPEAETAN